MAQWLLQINADQSRQAGLRYAEEGLWDVRHSLQELITGDNVCIWVSGREAGVFLAGRIAGPVEEHERPRDYGTPNGPRTSGHFVPVTYSHRLMDEHLVSRDELRQDKRFASALILRMAGGANPFPLTTQEWEAIEDRLSDEARVDAPTSLFHVRVFADAESAKPQEAADEVWDRLRVDGASGFPAEVRTTPDTEPTIIWDGHDEATGDTLVVIPVEIDAPRAQEALRMAWSDLEETPADAQGEWKILVSIDGNATILGPQDNSAAAQNN